MKCRMTILFFYNSVTGTEGCVEKLSEGSYSSNLLQFYKVMTLFCQKYNNPLLLLELKRFLSVRLFFVFIFSKCY